MYRRKSAFIISCSFLFFITLFRIFYSLQTGFLLPDEAIYFWTVKSTLNEGKIIFHYGVRYLFQLLLVGINIFSSSVWSYLVITPLVMFVFSLGVLTVLNGIFKKLGTESEWQILTFTFLPAFFLYVPFALSETPSLFFALLGIYGILQKNDFYASISLSIATFLRQNYLFVLLGMILYLFRNRENKRKVLLYSSIAAISTFLFFIFEFGVISDYLLYHRLPISMSMVTNDAIVSTMGPMYSTSQILSFPERFLYSIKNFFIGILVGWTPMLALHGFYSFSKERKIIPFLGYLSFFAALFYAGSVIWYSTFKSLSAVMRFASSSLLGIIGIKFTRKLFVSALLFTLIFVPVSIKFGLATQNPISFSLDKTPWVRLSEYAEHRGKVLIYGEPLSRIYLFVGDNVVIKRPVFEEEFLTDLEGDWDLILLYGEKHPNHLLALRDWYKEFLDNENLRIVWEDSESYCYEIP